MKTIIIKYLFPPILYVGNATDIWINGYRIIGTRSRIINEYHKTVSDENNGEKRSSINKLINATPINIIHPRRVCFPIIVFFAKMDNANIPTSNNIVETNNNVPIKQIFPADTES